jgi:2,4-dienoyl-CoA reductase-like NADH-dependent reductase (Old Yellow Enzyme family)/thioredoxin reductase
MPPMETIHNNADGSVSEYSINYYSERARGGVGLIIVQNSHIDVIASRSAIGMLSIATDHMIAGLSKLSEAIKLGGAAAIIQLGHGGRQTNTECVPGVKIVAPSPVPWTGGAMPKELTLEEIEEVQNAFANAARRAKWAGFDGVEIHGAHGYLIGEFISPKTNLRTDKYGGSLANRGRFVLEIIDKVRQVVGNDFTVGFRMSGDEFVPGGLILKEAAPYAKMVADTGNIDYIHVSGATYESFPHLFPIMYYKRGHLIHLAEGVKKLVKKIPIIAVGSLDAESGERVLQEGKADLVAIGRGLIADPDMPNKLAAGMQDDIRPCILGNEGCLSNCLFGRPVRCEVNPACGREAEFKLGHADTRKNVTIIGGGIAGMEAARIGVICGHNVTLIEENSKLGGHLNEASAPEFKGTLKELLGWARRQVKNAEINLKLKTKATPQLVKETKPDVLIIAVGSKYTLPKVRGKEICLTARDVLLGTKQIGEKNVVIGGGTVGCETALYIAEELKSGKKVTIIEMLDDILLDQELFNKMVLKERLEAAGVEIHTGWTVTEIKDKVVVCEDSKSQQHKVAADTVVSCTGLEAKEDLVNQLKSLAPKVFVIGDCAKAGKIYNAFEDAWRAFLSI